MFHAEDIISAWAHLFHKGDITTRYNPKGLIPHQTSAAIHVIPHSDCITARPCVVHVTMLVFTALMLNTMPTLADPEPVDETNGLTTLETCRFLSMPPAAAPKDHKVRGHGISITPIPTVTSAGREYDTQDVTIPSIVIPTAFLSNVPPLAPPTLETYGVQDMSAPTAFGPPITDADQDMVIHTPAQQITKTIALTSSAQSQNSMDCPLDPIWNLPIASWSAFAALCDNEASKSMPSSGRIVGRMTTVAPTTLSTHGISGSLEEGWTPLAGTGSRVTASNRISTIPGPHTKPITASNILSPTSGFSAELSVARTQTPTTTTGFKSVAPNVRIAQCGGLTFVAGMLGFIIWL